MAYALTQFLLNCSREEFLRKYHHQRSNAESVFSMVKAKFGDSVRSRTDTAMQNEVYCKFIAYNIYFVLMSQVELGIEPVFWEGQTESVEPTPTKPAPEIVSIPAVTSESTVSPAPVARMTQRIFMCGA